MLSSYFHFLTTIVVQASKAANQTTNLELCNKTVATCRGDDGIQTQKSNPTLLVLDQHIYTQVQAVCSFLIVNLLCFSTK